MSEAKKHAILRFRKKWCKKPFLPCLSTKMYRSSKTITCCDLFYWLVLMSFHSFIRNRLSSCFYNTWVCKEPLNSISEEGKVEDNNQSKVQVHFDSVQQGKSSIDYSKEINVFCVI